MRLVQAGQPTHLGTPHHAFTHQEIRCVSLEHPGQVQLLDLSLKTGGQSRVHGGPSREHYVLVELCPGVYVCSLDGVEEKLGHACSLNVDEVRLEEDLWRFKPLAAKLHHSAIGKLETRQDTQL